jgi:threonine/homoserine efflux transporter RhtA
MSIYYVSLALVHSPAFAVTSARVVATLMLAMLVAALVRSPLSRTAHSASRTEPVLPRLSLAVGISGALGTIAYGHAATATTATLISIVAIVSMSPVVTAVLGYWRRGDQLSTLQLGGLTACVIGACMAAVSTL